MILNSAASETAAWLQALEVGSERWWQAVADRGAPFCEQITEDTVCATFLWRDPQGGPKQSSTLRVFIDVNSVTNHHSLEPASLTRIGETDVWYWQAVLPADWRGSYLFIPVGEANLPPSPVGELDVQRNRHRQWWRAVLDHAQPDALNPRRPHASAWGGALSALHLPQAPDQSAWQQVDSGQYAQPATLRTLDWHSELLGNRRRIWIHATGAGLDEAQRRQRPLVLLLDGQHWAMSMPIYSALDSETAAGRLPPAVYVLIDVIDGARRQEELSCEPLFWQAVQAELLPKAAAIEPFSDEAGHTVVAGQSLGGLSAAYAGLHWPERFGRVLSQSGSFWWPHVNLLDAPPGQPCPRKPGSRGRLAEHLAAGKLAQGGLRVFMEVGSREDVMIDVNDSLHEGLRQAGHEVHYRRFEGGHDWLCWRGGLLDGLSCLLAP
ncbi:enterochelin esterase [Chitinimonas arctica]|uniref:Enterochelin esterase n=1 Tax=Chitinimonas arctica TaxID=2594795 RepID=A0A516SGB2_9NEIS|nr:enterochelin esterase [Chitinimonas arctica]QDQ27201.1 enterochelin esterase [Chitinimonas arctica]